MFTLISRIYIRPTSAFCKQIFFNNRLLVNTLLICQNVITDVFYEHYLFKKKGIIGVRLRGYGNDSIRSSITLNHLAPSSQPLRLDGDAEGNNGRNLVRNHDRKVN